MALFTEAQANACLLKRCERYSKDGSHNFFILGAEDEDGNYYEFSDRDLAGDSDMTAVKAQLKAKLLTVEKKAAPVAPNSGLQIDDIPEGTTLG